MISALGLGHLEAAEGEARGKSCEGRLKEGMEDDADGALTSVLCCSDCGVNLGQLDSGPRLSAIFQLRTCGSVQVQVW